MRTPAAAAAALRPAAYKSSVRALGALYLALTLWRWGLYVLHSLLAPLTVALKDGQTHAHLLSDHILLGVPTYFAIYSESIYKELPYSQARFDYLDLGILKCDYHTT